VPAPDRHPVVEDHRHRVLEHGECERAEKIIVASSSQPIELSWVRKLESSVTMAAACPGISQSR
jgi:hypothetical protein